MIRLSIQKPVSVAVGVILILLFGALSLFLVPIQLTPDIVKPEITIETRWRGASPHEVEREIIDEQEEQLKGIEGVERITSESLNGVGTILLRFPAGTDMNAALLRVSNHLEQVPEYPDEADRPVLYTSNRTDNAMAWFILLRKEGNTADMESYYDLCDEVVKPRFERVEGVSSASIFGGRETELQVIIRPEALAARGLTISQVLRSLDRENSNISAGDFEEGKHTYLVRTIGEYLKPEDVEQVVLETREGRRVYVRDVAEVRLGMKKRENFVRQRGQPAIAISALRRPGANVLETMDRLQRAVEELNRSYLDQRGLYLVQVYDETEYINDSIDLVVQSLWMGSLLATAVLVLFLRSAAATFIIAASIPISIVGSFILLHLFGRTINVISLAGMSFASGMVVDNSIVTLENIFRLRQEGMGRVEAAYQGACEVWGAILASTLTTIAVFLPLFFVEDQAAQLFRDIALAISCSVGLSLIVSITLIPTMAARLLRKAPVPVPVQASGTATAASGARRGPFALLRDFFPWSVALLQRRVSLRILVVAGMTGLSIWLSLWLLPDAEYLPQGNRNLAIGIILPPPGYSLTEVSRMGERVEEALAPRFSREGPGEDGGAPEAAGAGAGSGSGSGGALPSALAARIEERSPGLEIKNFFFVARDNRVFMGATATDPEKAGELVPEMQAALNDLPGVIAVTQQASLFQRGAAAARSVDIEITGPDVEKLVAIGGRVFGQVLQHFPFHQGHQARPIPSLDLQNPELHIVPDRERARDLGLDAEEIGIAVDALLDGIKASEYRTEGRQLDLTVMGGEPSSAWRTQDFEHLPIHTPEGKLVPLGSVARVEVSRGPQQLNHLERQRVITVQLVPSARMPIERAMRTIEREIVAPLKESGAVEGAYDVRLSGTADDLVRALKAFRWNFILAVVICYLLMASLFESFLYPLVILFSVPLAAVGGILCFHLVDRFVAPVSFDVLALLGFVILVGVVVNNAILLVDRALQAARAGMPIAEAIVDSVRTRLRPIFMTSATSVFGMMPLVLFPGAGSELYRGLGSVVLGGLAVSTLFTLFLVPSLLGLVLSFQEWLSRSSGGEVRP